MSNIKSHMQNISNEDLIDLIDNHADDYTSEALSFANRELESRGGRQQVLASIEPVEESDQGKNISRELATEDDLVPEILVTTETAFADLQILERIDIVTAEVAIGMNIFKDIMTSARDIVGGRSATIQKSLAKAKNTVIAEIKQNAAYLNANAIVGLRLEYNEISSGRSMLLLVAVGTAVTINEETPQ